MTAKVEWVDFRQVKAAVTLQMALDRYRINWLRRQGDELRGRCPIHQGEGERSFHVSLTKNAFNCFSCKARGNVLDFVAAMEKCSIRDAALLLRDWFGVGEGSGSTVAPDRPKPDVVEKVSNPPLGFQLRVDPGHEYGRGRGLTEETITLFGAGLCLSKGVFSGRYVIPLHDEQGRLVGYAGRSLDGVEPKYLFPAGEKGFAKSKFLFNLHRVIKSSGADAPVIVVEGFFDAMWLAQAGLPAVAVMGCSISEAQEELLAEHFNRVVLLFDGDEAGRRGAADALPRLARRIFTRVVDLPDGIQPDLLADLSL